MLPRNEMYFTDLVILKVIADNSEGGVGIPVTRIVDACNAWLLEHQVPVSYAAEFTSNSQRDISIDLLESLGLAEHVGRRRGYTATDLGREFIDQLGDDWRLWFLYIPIQAHVTKEDYELESFDPDFAFLFPSESVSYSVNLLFGKKASEYRGDL